MGRGEGMRGRRRERVRENYFFNEKVNLSFHYSELRCYKKYIFNNIY